MPQASPKSPVGPRVSLQSTLRRALLDSSPRLSKEAREKLLEDVPKKWERLGDLALLPAVRVQAISIPIRVRESRLHCRLCLSVGSVVANLSEEMSLVVV